MNKLPDIVWLWSVSNFTPFFFFSGNSLGLRMIVLHGSCVEMIGDGEHSLADWKGGWEVSEVACSFFHSGCMSAIQSRMGQKSQGKNGDATLNIVHRCSPHSRVAIIAPRRPSSLSDCPLALRRSPRIWRCGGPVDTGGSGPSSDSMVGEPGMQRQTHWPTNTRRKPMRSLGECTNSTEIALELRIEQGMFRLWRPWLY